MSELSYLEKLLDGAEVEWVALNKLATFLKGKSLPKEKITPDGNRYCIHYGELFTHYGPIIDKVCSKTNQAINESILSEKNDVLMPTSDVTPRGLATASCIQESGVILGGDILIIRCSGVDGRYLSNFIINNKKKILQMVKGSTVYHLYAKDIGKLLIPIPCPNNPEKSLAIQSEIVRILDKFTALTAELTAELTARKKQYNYYRDQLLSFEGGEVEWRALGEIAAYSKSRISFDKLDENNYVGVDNLLQNRAGKMQSNYVPTSGNLTEFREGDILIGNIRPYLKKIWQADSTGGTNGDVLVIRSCHESILPRYLYQILADENFFEYNMQHAKGAKMPRGNKDAIMKYRLPIPSLNEQTRIVSVLDKFDTLTNSISEGLPREIELRQKQYEYYRDLLFSFPKPDSVTN
ncbi:restriction endonuclease subunit S [Salmonella enterica subsp. enterica serovar Mbandaka]|uniref:restriction endonuclease subunit S n=1 Tax=Klebsiella quasipneumoniae TaxID=1463165 RepID=UPI001DDF6559|nr:restriction endonuclease subunit S [Salmonella enterica subsp. enterica serovar Mbandaka]EHN5975960.1 restriction endonuclease subunit S [Salmonella enterica subsp. enterica serovar Mbandaka]EHT1913550.1 restriction endonuclease subunit S [Salmonella enterica subsp. enterica serovar Mbandaka]EII1471348.1 restriction endonuclease subunit S [Salmonella enterica subsp. enterica serovar Mbandaka]EIQ7968091.1 restriction endonuclease subunit S [Salmonella enterica subsp. enterica serovar Mbandaka